jgi:hypothetical protein
MSAKIIERKWFRVALGLIAVIGMVALASYQRRTGPTWPISVAQNLGQGSIAGELPRSHGGDGGALVSLAAPPDVSGEIRWRRYPTQDVWQTTAMARSGDRLTAELPHQLPAGKLEYSVRLSSSAQQLVLPESEAAVIRFRDDVPAWILIPHILCMFIALAIVLRSAFGALLDEKRLGRFAPWVLAFLVPGGFILGPLVQKFAFGAYWGRSRGLDLGAVGTPLATATRARDSSSGRRRHDGRLPDPAQHSRQRARLVRGGRRRAVLGGA